jgi:hypothetical protein
MVAGALALPGSASARPDRATWDDLGTVIIKKKTVGGDGTFSFSGTGTGIPSYFTITTAGGSGSRTFADIAPGAKSVTENGPPSGWTFTGVTCYDPDYGTRVSGRTAYIDLDAGETVVCTFKNEKKPPPQPGFMTGGGQFNPDGPCPDPRKDFANFGGNASGPPAKGHFNYINHCTGLHINGTVTAVTDVVVDENGVTVQMTFEVAFNGCTAIVTWRDVAEPGGRRDTIRLLITGSGCPPNQAATPVPIDNGNIQGHKGTRS